MAVGSVASEAGSEKPQTKGRDSYSRSVMAHYTLAAMFTARPAESVAALEDRVRAFQRNEGEAAVRLAAKNLTRNQRTLAAFRGDPAFGSLYP